MAGQTVNVLDTYGKGIQAGQQARANALALQEGQTERKMKAAQMLAQGVINSPDKPNAYKMALGHAERMGMDISAFPGEYGPDAELALRMVAMPSDERTEFERLTSGLPPDQVRRALMIKLGMEPKAAAAPAPPLDPSLIREMRAMGFDPASPEGRAEYNRRTAKTGGMRVYGPDGKPLVETGGAIAAPLGRKGRGDVEGGLITDTAMLGNVNRIGEIAGIGPDGKMADDARYMLTYPGRAANWATVVAEKWGIKPEEADAESTRRFTKFTMATEALFNAYRKDITGAAASVKELERLQKAFLNKEMSPTEFEAAYSEYVGQLKRSMRLRRKFMRDGLDISDFGEDGKGGPKLDLAFALGEDDDAAARYAELADELGEEKAYEILVEEGYSK